MKHTAEWTPIDDRRTKFVHQWAPDAWTPDDDAPVVCVVHGLGEHGGRYDGLARQLVPAGLRVVAFDQQGHGHSPERRGCIDSYASLMDDIEAFISWAAPNPSQRRVLLGHSMGGNLVLNYALRKSALPCGVISSSPMIRAANEPHWLVERVGRVLMRMCPNYTLKSRPRAESLMSHPEEQAAFRNDDLFHAELSLRLGAELLDTGRWLLEHAHQLKVPTLLSHGTNDYLTCYQASQEFAGKAGEICQLEIFEDHLHDPFRDIDREEVIQKWVSFVYRLPLGVSA